MNEQTQNAGSGGACTPARSPNKPAPKPAAKPAPEPATKPPAQANPAEPAVTLPALKPADPRFSSGPCRKHPGWNLSALDTQHLGRSHRASTAKARLQSAIERCRELMQLPPDWKLGIVPGSDTGAFEMAIWSLLGSRSVTALVWESFSSDWANDLSQLGIEPLEVRQADYGELPDLNAISSDNDIVFVYNGTTSGVCLPNLDFIESSRQGLVLCDATSALFSVAIDYSKLDVVTWSWQKVLGGEAAHGMLALSPAAVERLQQPAPRPLPKLFRLTSKGKLNEGIFSGATINTPSMLAVEDLHSALDWADRNGGGSGLIARSATNFDTLQQWVEQTPWIDWLARQPAHRSHTSMCLSIIGEKFCSLSPEEQKQTLKLMLSGLEQNQIAFDIGNYRSAPTGFRIWGGATVEAEDIALLTQWLDYAYALFERDQLSLLTQENPHV